MNLTNEEIDIIIKQFLAVDFTWSLKPEEMTLLTKLQAYRGRAPREEWYDE